MLKQETLVSLGIAFPLECGATLTKAVISVTTYGTLNADLSNVVFVGHALTGSGMAAEWWSGLIGSGRLIDTEKYFVVCPNFLGSCYGSTGPIASEPFPVITIRDIARANLLAVKGLGVDQFALAIGGSMGAMVLLEQALLQPQFAEKLVVIATGASQTAWRIAFSSVVRKVIASFGSDAKSLQKGLALARQLAMTSYRSSDEFNVRFGRERVDDDPSRFHDGSNLFEVERYLEHQGRKIVERFSPESYLALTRAMELYDLGRGRGASALDALSSIEAKTLVIGIDSDILYPEDEVRALADAIPNAQYKTLHAECGHDSFLASTERLIPLITPFLARTTQQRIGAPRRRRVAA